MTSKLTIEQAKRLRNDFECWQQDYDPKDDKEQYDMFGRGMVAMDMLIAGMYQEPVAYTDERNLGYIDRGRETAYLWGKQNSEASDVALYRHAQPAVDSDFIPKNLDKALGVVGVAIPESREEFNLQAERWIQRLIDRVIRYADEFQEQPAPVVPKEMTAGIAVKHWEGGRGSIESFVAGYNFYRAAMLQASAVCTCPSGDGSLRWPCPVHAGNSPAIPDGYVMVPKEATLEMIKSGASAASNGMLIPGIYKAMLAAADCSIPMISDRWIPVSEQMPEREVDVQVYCPDKKEQMVAYLERNELEGYFRFATWRTGDGIYCQPTHWMPLPAAPQEGK
ncbi:DUF551 domain-containing protein [Klebsiella pneumoniae]|uniref:DUF551 domain-containing protein n=1 Tax=Klebsiella pneumoniae TaxID=573 RepID=UPI000983407C|nr:DUF551 domain-containing protein [Klebsiella pneumoniae]EKU4310121.1 DUF551 domain-containing protein [Klebsiella pneumoniae]EKV0197505.1 DUF551 domain-containing protein [Klebsiella pneumoniae]EKV6232219.1 DUF551 domain-containing protein [Klebsiella pneumoniae]EKV7481521.1 DUF551 domain-containing protein [Klebsiella pneumoniae]EKX1046095.1 DUF551 domain-containing protein [Klebsiella pneumoniae]